MASTITFSNGAESISINTPQWGYKALIQLPLHYTRRSEPKYGIYDDGVAYDVRILQLASYLTDATDMGAINGFFNDSTKGRGEDVSMNLGTNSGFYPFGPDKGDAGVFTVRPIAYTQGGQLHRPYKWWDTGISLLMVSAPSYALPAQVDDGPMQIGSITGIRYPQDGFNPPSQYQIKNVVTLDSTAHEVDRKSTADRYETEFTVSGNQTKMAALLNYLVLSARGNDFNIIPGSNTYAYGYDKGASGTYLSQMLNSTLTVTHTHYDNFSLPLKLSFTTA